MWNDGLTVNKLVLSLAILHLLNMIVNVCFHFNYSQPNAVAKMGQIEDYWNKVNFKLWLRKPISSKKWYIDYCLEIGYDANLWLIENISEILDKENIQRRNV